MNTRMTIRNETPGDIGAITEDTSAAFKTLAVSQYTEQFIIEALRAFGVLKNIAADHCISCAGRMMQDRVAGP